MASANFGYGNPYATSSNRPSSQPPRQSYPPPQLSSAGPYYGLQATAMGTDSYASADVQSPQYASPQRSSGGVPVANWFGSLNGIYTGQGNVLGNHDADDARSEGQYGAAHQRMSISDSQPYEMTGLGNLAYASSLEFRPSTDAARRDSEHTNTPVGFEGQGVGAETSSSQSHYLSSYGQSQAQNRRQNLLGSRSLPTASTQASQVSDASTNSPTLPSPWTASYPQTQANTAAHRSYTTADQGPDLLSKKTRQSWSDTHIATPYPAGLTNMPIMPEQRAQTRTLTFAPALPTSRQSTPAILPNAKSKPRTSFPPRSSSSNRKVVTAQPSVDDVPVPTPSPIPAQAPPTNLTEMPLPTVQTPNSGAQEIQDPDMAAIEDDMRLMLEKMREYQSRNPEAFSKAWHSVKDQASNPGASPIIGAATAAAISTPPTVMRSPIITGQQAAPVGAARTQPVTQTEDDAGNTPLATSPKAKRKRQSRSKAAVAERAAKQAERTAPQKTVNTMATTSSTGKVTPPWAGLPVAQRLSHPVRGSSERPETRIIPPTATVHRQEKQPVAITGTQLQSNDKYATADGGAQKPSVLPIKQTPSSTTPTTAAHGPQKQPNVAAGDQTHSAAQPSSAANAQQKSPSSPPDDQTPSVRPPTMKGSGQQTQPNASAATPRELPLIASQEEPVTVAAQRSSSSAIHPPSVISSPAPPHRPVQTPPARAHASPALEQEKQRQQPQLQQRPEEASTGNTKPLSIPPQPQKGVIWPKQHQERISKIAVDVLNAIPENAGKRLIAWQVQGMLRSNPDYTELCENIERLGFRFDRARFAQTLLSHISWTPQSTTTARAPDVPKAGGSVTEASTAGQGRQSNARTNSGTQTLPPTVSVNLGTNSSQATAAQQPPQNGPKDSPRSSATAGFVNITPSNPPQGLMAEPSKRGRGRPRKDGQPSLQRAFAESNTSPAPSSAPSKTAPSLMQSTPRSAYPNSAPGSTFNSFFAPYTRPHDKNTNAAPVSHGTQSSPPSTWLPDARDSRVEVLSSRVDRQTTAVPTSNNSARRAGGEGSTRPNQIIHPTPMSKEMAARKRTFAEIVDLTSDGDVENGLSSPSRKIRRVDDASYMQGIASQPGARVNGKSLFRETSRFQPVEVEPDKTHDAPGQASSTVPGITDSSANEDPTLYHPIETLEDLIEPIDKAVALRKSKYHPKTVARDVLVSISQHPTQRGLNAHLVQLQRRFPRVNHNSDLSTFRWDIVDPGGPLIGSDNMPQSTTFDQSVPVPSPNESMKKDLTMERPRFKPTRGGLASRGRGRPRASVTTPARPSSLRQEVIEIDDDEVEVDADSRVRPSSASLLRGPAKVAPEEATVASSTPKPRGRPRKETNINEMASLPKRRGRPPKYLTEAEISEAASQLPKRRGRPPRNSTAKPAVPPAKFYPFLCEWMDCKAELQNLDTLRRHIYAVHARELASGTFACLWARCGTWKELRHPVTLVAETKHRALDFDNITAFKNHMEQAHLSRFAWQMGDGPRGSSVDGHESDASSFLSDAHGRQVTPSVSGQKIEAGNAGRNNKRRLERESNAYDPSIENPLPFITPAMRRDFRDDGLVQPLADDDFYHQARQLEKRKGKQTVPDVVVLD
ncbi:MAG: hypothetical protein M1818_001790 [Claussenomyces sp. TS43310]|nr:MAG: hypothetical protein M1818_001790 [Claussenomyces sp. TS43310]